MSKTKVQTFFPGTRKEVMILSSGTGLLSDKRVQLALSMKLSDGRLVGMPDWLSDAYVLIAKDNGWTGTKKHQAQLDGVEVKLYANDSQEEPILVLESCSIQSLSFVRGNDKKNGAVGNVDLHFTLSTISYNAKLWKMVPDYFMGTLFMQFAGTQMTMVFKKKKEGEEDGESEEPNLLGPEHDAEFGAKQSTQLAARVAASSTTGKVTEMPSGSQRRLSPAAQAAADVMDGKPKKSAAKKTTDTQRRS